MKQTKNLTAPLWISCLLLLAGCGKNLEDRMSQSNPDFKISTEDILKEFESDRKTAIEKYRGKILEISGPAGLTGQNIKNDSFLMLEGGKSVSVVQCYFFKQTPPEISQIKKGQPLTVRGKCTDFIMNLILDQCIIVQNK